MSFWAQHGCKSNQAASRACASIIQIVYSAAQQKREIAIFAFCLGIVIENNKVAKTNTQKTASSGGRTGPHPAAPLPHTNCACGPSLSLSLSLSLFSNEFIPSAQPRHLRKPNRKTSKTKQTKTVWAHFRPRHLRKPQRRSCRSGHTTGLQRTETLAKT